MPARHLSAKETNVFIRAALTRHFQRAFPTVTFSVTSPHRASTYVRWIDGPPEPLVEAALDLFQPSHDGRCDDVLLDGQRVIPGCSHLFCERSYSADFLQAVAAEVAARLHIEMPPIEDGSSKGAIDVLELIVQHRPERSSSIIDIAARAPEPRQLPAPTE